MTDDGDVTTGGFSRDGDALVPSRSNESGWAPNTLMGRYLAGLVAWGVERDATPGLQPARLTVDMFRPPTMGRTTVETTVVRRGRRIEVIDADVRVDGVLVCRGTVVHLARSAEPPGERWMPPDWNPPDPEALVRMEGRPGTSLPWDQRAHGNWAEPGAPRSLWLREVGPFIDGEPTSPFLRAALAADNANGALNAGTSGLSFINADLTMTLARLPVGEWIGLDPISRATADGVSTGAADLYDRQGRIGQVAMIALADGRNIGSPRTDPPPR